MYIVDDRRRGRPGGLLETRGRPAAARQRHETRGRAPPHGVGPPAGPRPRAFSPRKRFFWDDFPLREGHFEFPLRRTFYFPSEDNFFPSKDIFVTVFPWAVAIFSPIIHFHPEDARTHPPQTGRARAFLCIHDQPPGRLNSSSQSEILTRVPRERSTRARSFARSCKTQSPSPPLRM